MQVIITEFKDLKRFQNAIRFVSENPRLLREYPEVFADLIATYFSVTGKPKEEVRTEVMRDLRKRVGLLRLLGDGWRAQKYLL